LAAGYNAALPQNATVPDDDEFNAAVATGAVVHSDSCRKAFRMAVEFQAEGALGVSPDAVREFFSTDAERISGNREIGFWLAPARGHLFEIERGKPNRFCQRC